MRDERTGGGERRVDRRWRETCGPAVAIDERTGGGERRVDRRWRETSGQAVARDVRTGGGERRVDRRWRETSGPAVARDEWTGGGERRVDRWWRETSGQAVARDEWTGGGERRVDRRWRETSGPAVTRDERTGGGERRADRRWRETRLVMHRDIFTTLRYLFKNQLVTAKSHADLAECFFVFFFDKTAKIRHSRNPCDAPPPLPQIDNNNENCTLSAFTSTTATAIIRLVNKCPRKSCFLDPLPTSLLKTNMNSIVPTLVSIINVSLEPATVPSDMKHALVTPLPKKTGLDANDIKNYRPISNLSLVLKLLERHVAVDLRRYIDENKLLNSFQREHIAHITALKLLLSVFTTHDSRFQYSTLLRHSTDAFNQPARPGTSMGVVLPVQQNGGDKNRRCHISSTTAVLWCAAGVGS